MQNDLKSDVAYFTTHLHTYRNKLGFCKLREYWSFIG